MYQVQIWQKIWICFQILGKNDIIFLVESDKTTSIYNVSTRVLSKK